MNKKIMVPGLPISRRVFNKLSITGAALLASPIKSAYAQSEGKAKRFIAAYNTGGFYLPVWMKGGGTGLNYGTAVAPLEPYRENMIALKGLNNVAARDTQHHHRGMGSFLTGHQANAADFKRTSRDRSIDQFIADQIGGDSRFKSLEIGFRVDEEVNSETRMVYSAPGSAIQPISDPKALFNKLFAGIDISTGNNASDPRANATRELRRTHVLDSLKLQIAMMKRELTGNDNVKLDEHLDTVEQLQRRVNTMQDDKGMGPSCTAQAPSDAFDVHEEIILLGDLMGAALSCGLTNVATFQSSRAASLLRYEWLEGAPGEGWHPATHAHKARSASIRKWYEQIDLFNARMIARVLYHLDNTPEGSGTMLDHTLGFWGGDVREPNGHSHKNLHWVGLGGKGVSGWPTNKYIDARGENLHNLHISILHEFGVMVQKFGNNGGKARMRALGNA